MERTNTVQPSTFTCSVCFDDKATNPKPIEVAGDQVCRECYDTDIKSKFFQALRNENDYPVRWGNTILDPKHMPGFSPSFLTQWREKIQEYKTPAEQRIYCSHKVLRSPGSKHALNARQLENARPEAIKECRKFLGQKDDDEDKHTVICSSCSGRVCSGCAGMLPRSVTHECEKPREQAEADAFDGLARGKDYQLCPECKLPVTLADGCNSIICRRCFVHFCYICGQQAHHDSDHWKSPNGCPRWNQPGADNAHHDPLEADELPVPEWFQNFLQFGAAAEFADPAGLDRDIGGFFFAGQFCFRLPQPGDFVSGDFRFGILGPAPPPPPGLAEIEERRREQEHAREILVRQANVELDEPMRQIKLKQAELVGVYVDALRGMRNQVFGPRRAEFEALQSLITALSKNMEAHRFVTVGEEVPAEYRVRHVQIRELVGRIDAIVWAQHPRLFELYTEYTAWAHGQL